LFLVSWQALLFLFLHPWSTNPHRNFIDVILKESCRIIRNY
jgi:hypothetical protein